MVYKITFTNLLKSGLQSGSIMFVADSVTQFGLEKRIVKNKEADLQLKLKTHDKSPIDGTIEQPTKETSNAVMSQKYDVELPKYYDPYRTFRWTTAGLFLHGPYFAKAFSSLDQYFGMQTTMKNVLKKTMAGQIIFFPPYLFLLFGYMSILEDNGSTENVLYKIQTKVPDALIGGCFFWPIANIINFRMVPSTLRVPYIAIIGSVWNCFLSWLNG